MIIFVITIGTDHEGSEVVGAFGSFDEAMGHADRVEYGDDVMVCRCDPDASEFWKRDGYNRNDLPPSGRLLYQRIIDGRVIGDLVREIPAPDMIGWPT